MPIIHSVIVSQPKKLPEIVVTNLTITAPSVTEFGICLVNEYTKHGPTDQILAPYTISIVEKSKTEKVVEHCEPVSEEKEPDAIHPEPENVSSYFIVINRLSHQNRMRKICFIRVKNSLIDGMFEALVRTRLKNVCTWPLMLSYLQRTDFVRYE